MQVGAARALRLVFAGLFIALCGCSDDKTPEGVYQGYAKAEYRYLATPDAGYVAQLAVHEGENVQAGQLLFSLNGDPQRQRLAQAQEDLAAARAQLADAQKGERQPTLDALSAAVEASQADLKRLRLQLKRQEDLVQSGATPQQNLDEVRETERRMAALVDEAKARLAQAKQPAREDAITALQAQVAGREAAVSLAQWELDQVTLHAPLAGNIEEVLYRKGEWVPAGRPVIVLYPPEGLVGYFFVPDTALSSIKIGAEVEVSADGAAGSIAATVASVSSDPEFTPPVIFSNQTRGKLLYRVKIDLSGAADKLHPGQPVTVSTHARGQEKDTAQ